LAKVEKGKGSLSFIPDSQRANKDWVHTPQARVLAGQRIGIYLNTEVDFKQNPVYMFEVRANTVVLIHEQGELTPDDSVFEPAFTAEPESVQCLKSYLTPATWMKITHRYTADEAKHILDKTNYPENVKNATLCFFDGRSFKGPKNQHEVTLTRADGTQVKFESPDGGSSSTYAFFSQSIPPLDSREVMGRTSPIAYAAIIHAAQNVPSLRSVLLFSLWRAIYASVLHREGRALDVASLNKDAEFVNRKADKGKNNPYKTEDFSKTTDLGSIRLKEAKNIPLSEAEKKRKAELLPSEDEIREKNLVISSEEQLLGKDITRTLRLNLQKDSNVTHLFDPWLMDYSVGDSNAGSANTGNTQGKDNDNLHSNHIHITVKKAHG
jgi:hypothetical protein